MTMTTSDMIRRIMQRDHLTQQQLAAKLSTTQAQVSRWLGGQEAYSEKAEAIRDLLYRPIVKTSHGMSAQRLANILREYPIQDVQAAIRIPAKTALEFGWDFTNWTLQSSPGFLLFAHWNQPEIIDLEVTDMEAERQEAERIMQAIKPQAYHDPMLKSESARLQNRINQIDHELLRRKAAATESDQAQATELVAVVNDDPGEKWAFLHDDTIPTIVLYRGDIIRGETGNPA